MQRGFPKIMYTHTWYIGYSHRKWTQWAEFEILNEAVSILYSASTFGKGMNPAILHNPQQWVNSRADCAL